MKKIFSILLTLVITNTLWAYDFKSGDLYYNITNRSAPFTVEVTYPEYRDESYKTTHITIPETVTYQGITYSVTSIRFYAFQGCTSITSVTIGDNVTSIGEEAFRDCSSLTSIVISNSVTSIGDRVFCGCSLLESIIIGNSVVSIGDYAFSDCKSLTSVIIGSNVTSIGKGMFYECSRLKSIVIGERVTSIGSHAFNGCKNLTSIAIPNSVEIIDSYAFDGCNLETLYIGTYLQSIGANTFSTLKEIIIRATTPPIIEYSTFPTNMSITAKVPNGSLSKYQTAAYWSKLNLEVLGSDSEPREITCIEAVAIGGTLALNTSTEESYIVTGYVTETDGVVSRGQQRFWMADTPNGGSVFQCYWGNVTEAVAVGDKVSVTGQIMCYNFTYEIKNGDVVVLSKGDDLPTYTVTVSSSNTSMGTVYGGGNYIEGASATVTAIPKSGYKFTKWSDGTTKNPYTFTVTKDVRLTAYFEKAQQTCSVTVSSANTSMGTVSGGGEYEEGTTATVTATPKSGYRFTKWSDGTTKNPYTFTVTKDVTLIAYFEKVSYSVWYEITCKEAAAIAASLPHNTPTSETYTVIGYVTETDGVISREQQRFWMADNLNDGNVFQSYWGNVTEAVAVGDKVSLTGQIMRYNSTYQIKNGDVELLLRENKPKIYTVTVSSDDTSMGTVSGGGEYEEGTVVTVTATPKNGYTFFAWNDCSTMNPYTFTVTEDIDLIAYFDFDSSIEQISCEEAAAIAASLPHNTPTTATYTVIGYITETDGVISRNQQRFWMADYPDDENVFQCYWGNVTEVMNVGDKVAITGQIMRYNSTCQIKNGDVVRLSSEEVISCEEAVEFVNTFLQNNATTAAIYNVVGYVTETDGVISRGQQRFWMADTPNGGKVFQSYWGNVSETIKVGDYVSVRGHLMRYNSTAQIKNGDVTVLSYGTGVDDVVIHKTFDKILRDGQLLIIRDDKTYHVMGQELQFWWIILVIQQVHRFWLVHLLYVKFLSLNEQGDVGEGFEGTDLASLSHLECLTLPRASSANQNEEVAEQLSFFCIYAHLHSTS